MTSISQYLKDYVNTKNTFLAFMRISRLLNSMEQLNNSWAGFAKFAKKFINGIYTPENVEQFCKDFFGVTTIEELTKLVESSDLRKMYDYIYPTFDNYIFDGTISGQQLLEILKSSWLEFTQSKDIVLVDTEYRVLTLDLLQTAIKKCPYNYTRNYEKSTFDCDDFALATKSWVNLRCGGANTFGYVHALFLDSNGKYLFAHAFNIAVITNEGSYKVCAIEPQTDNIYYSKEDVTSWFHSAKSFKINFVYL